MVNFSNKGASSIMLLAFSVCLVLFGVACGSRPDSTSTVKPTNDTPAKGVIRISVDESFKPVIDSQIKVYEAAFPNTKIIAEYKPEADCLKDLNSDSTRMVIVTRGLSEAEVSLFKKRLEFKPSFGILAFDAVALVINKNNKDSVFTPDEVKQMLEGTSKYPYKIVMDGLSATSTVRYAIDSILRGATLSKTVTAAKGSLEVINYVSNTPNTIGMVGVNWIGNEDDPEQLSFLKKISIASIRADKYPEQPYTKPYQANIAMGRYPFIRNLYYILKENYNGLGKGFMHFMIYERGQLIFKRAYLLPARMNFEVREMEIK
ncbi:MAG: phosphate ABC transporter substrate-binding protein, PhoT family [Bacteroidetes bacterium]|nr:MAG: phosphate ABC transporter substrate-binding protein, PhoT family [Bacteroidota bacterium]